MINNDDNIDNRSRLSSQRKGEGKSFLRKFAIPFFLKKIAVLFKTAGYAATKYVASKVSFAPWVTEYQLKKNYPLQEGQIGLITFWGLGDTLMVAGLANHLVTSGKAKSVALLVKPGHDYIAGLFPGIASVYTVPNFAAYIDANSNYPQLMPQLLAPNQYYYAHFFNWEMTGLIGYKKVNLLDAYRAVLKLDHKYNLLEPRPLLEQEFAAAQAVFRQYNLQPEKTVFVAPLATSITTFPENFWHTIYNTLLNNGYKIVLNGVTDNKLHHPDIISINMPFAQLIAFVKLCAGAISVRSGLCDLLSVYNINLVVLYPDMDWFYGNLFEGCSIKAMWPSPCTTEVIICEADELTAKSIVAKLTAN